MLQPRIMGSVASPTDFHRMASTVTCTGRELRIPIPYGEIAAVEWGPTDGIPVLALHGWQDNALSFQPLIPHLPSNLHVVAIDFPGHGLSSHYGAGATYSHFSYLNNVYQA
ncbi:Serine hydrolase-like protein 2 [Chamberlinius hualienensis]